MQRNNAFCILLHSVNIHRTLDKLRESKCWEKCMLPRTWIWVAPVIETRVALVARFLHLVTRKSLRWLCIIGVWHSCIGVVSTRCCVVIRSRLCCGGHTPNCRYNWQGLLGAGPTRLTLPTNIWVTEIKTSNIFIGSADQKPSAQKTI